MKKLLLPLVAIIVVTAIGWNYLSIPRAAHWSEDELRLIASLSLDALPPLSPDPSNRVADDPAAAELGHRLYFDTRLSSNGQVACATCHKPELMFTDGLPLAVGVGIGPVHTPSLVGLAYSPWFYWDGRKDSQWAQALAPLEAKHEHATDRIQLLQLLSTDSDYRVMYEDIFGELPVASNLPKKAHQRGMKNNWLIGILWTLARSGQYRNFLRILARLSPPMSERSCPAPPASMNILLSSALTRPRQKL